MGELAANTDQTQTATVPSAEGYLAHRPIQYRPIQIKEAPVENFRPLRVICIGAGFSGIYCAIRLPQRLRNVDLTVYDKNEGVGGTWWENRYPGCACDVPAHSYQYSFEPNPDWSNFYAPQKEIQAYLERTVKKYSADRYIKLSHKVVGCTWDPKRAKWVVHVQNLETGDIFVDQADIVINARGNLNNIAWPEIEGLKSFKGKLLHSGAWDQSYDFSNKTVGVIGAGSSAIQIIPNIQPLPGIKIHSFQRGRTWISLPFGGEAQGKLGMDHDKILPEDYEKWIADPEKYLKFRKLIEHDFNAGHPVTLKDSEIQKILRGIVIETMKGRLARKPEIFDHMQPEFGLGCRRLTPGVGYLEALCEDNVEYIPTAIEKITENGIKLADGREIQLDVLVCATGFKTSAPPPFPVLGDNGQALSDRWNPHPESYLSVAVDNFPNYFMMLGPNGAIGAGSLTMMIEQYGDYICKAIRKIQKEDIKTMVVKKERVKDFQSYCKEYFKRTVYMQDCRSWYRSEGGKGDMIIALWPGSTLHCIETLRAPRWEDYEYEYTGQEGVEEGKQNLLRWLGNGFSDLQIQEGTDLAYYLEPDLIDYPAHPYPEETWRYNKLAFSH